MLQNVIFNYLPNFCKQTSILVDFTFNLFIIVFLSKDDNMISKIPGPNLDPVKAILKG